MLFSTQWRGEWWRVRRSDRSLQAVLLQTLLMEIPLRPSRLEFGYRTTGPRAPLLPQRESGNGQLLNFECDFSSEDGAFRLMVSPLRTEHSDWWCPLWGQTPSFSTMTQGASAVSLPAALLCCVSVSVFWHVLLFHLDVIDVVQYLFYLYCLHFSCFPWVFFLLQRKFNSFYSGTIWLKNKKKKRFL